MTKINQILEVDIDSPLQDINTSSPETRLAAAVLERAICDLFSKHTTEKREAYAWFRCKDDEIEPFSFRWVAEALGFENGSHKVLRQAIFELDFFKFHNRSKSQNCRRVIYHKRKDIFNGA